MVRDTQVNLCTTMYSMDLQGESKITFVLIRN